jgi:hypothetical protein
MTFSPWRRVMMSIVASSSLENVTARPTRRQARYATRIGAQTVALKSGSSAAARTVSRPTGANGLSISLRTEPITPYG